MLIRVAVQTVFFLSIAIVMTFAWHPLLVAVDRATEPLYDTEPIAKWYSHELNQQIRRNAHKQDFPILSQVRIEEVIRYLLLTDAISPTVARCYMRASRNLALYNNRIYTASEFQDVLFVVEAATRPVI